MSGCSSGQAGSQFCDSCRDYSCKSNPCYEGYPKMGYDEVPYIRDIYKGVEHMKGVKAPDIPIIDIEEETKRQIRAIWDNF